MELDVLGEIYPDVILDHCRHPRNQARIEHPDIVADGVNPFCGDEVHLQISLDSNGRVENVGLQGKGCSINQATGSMLTEVIQGKSVAELEAIADVYEKMMRGDVVSERELMQLGELRAMAGVRHFPVRIKCALLAWATLADGIDQYRRNNARKET